MSEALIDAVARIEARRAGHAVATRATRDLVDDPDEVFVIAPIRVVSEEVIQAIAFGDPSKPPSIAVRWNPLSRDASAFELFAAGLNAYIDRCVGADRLPRFWLPYGTALDLIEVLGYRYATNKAATLTLQRMGAQCLALFDLSTYAGQQTVAVATDVLLRHVVTGQAPIKDHHLGSLLAWVEPEPGRDPTAVADARALEPAAAMLRADDDGEVEGLRRVAKGRTPAAAVAQARIEAILENAARVEWVRVLVARDAFFGLGLPAAATLGQLAKESKEKSLYYLGQPRSRPSRPATLTRRLDEHEYAEELARDASLRGDPVTRERARRAGRVVAGTVTGVVQPFRGRRPCTITLETTQAVLRVRRGTQLSRAEGGLSGRVLDVDDDGSRIRIKMEIKNGVRTVPAIGSTVEFVDSHPFDPTRILWKLYQKINTSPPPLIAGDVLVNRPRVLAETDLAAAAERLLP